MEEKKVHHRPSIFFPILLIGVGLIFLLSSLGIFVKDGWSLIADFWPVVFILMGLDNIYQRQSWIGSFILIGLGTVFTMSNLGMLPWGLNGWDLLFRLWPIFLVGWGMDLILRGRSPVVTIIGVVVAVALVAGIGWMAVSVPTAPADSIETVNQPLGDATSADIRIDMPVGALHVSGGGEPAQLISGKLNLPKGLRVTQSYDSEGKHGSYNLYANGYSTNTLTGFTSNFRWDLLISPSPEIDLRTNFGVGSAQIDLSTIQASQVKVEQGVGSMTVTLPDSGELDLSMSMGVGSITLQIPKGASVRVYLDTGLVPVSVSGSGLQRNGEIVTTSAAREGTAKMDVRIEGGVGTLRIVEIP